MKEWFEIERKFLTKEGETVEPLYVDLEIPDEIWEKLWPIEGNLDYLKKGIREFFEFTRFYKEPSEDSEEVKALEISAYRCRRDGNSNPFADPKYYFDVPVEPKYKPVWKEVGNQKIGWKNDLSTYELRPENPDPAIDFVMNAYWFLS